MLLVFQLLDSVNKFHECGMSLLIKRIGGLIDRMVEIVFHVIVILDVITA